MHRLLVFSLLVFYTSRLSLTHGRNHFDLQHTLSSELFPTCRSKYHHQTRLIVDQFGKNLKKKKKFPKFKFKLDLHPTWTSSGPASLHPCTPPSMHSSIYVLAKADTFYYWCRWVEWRGFKEPHYASDGFFLSHRQIAEKCSVTVSLLLFLLALAGNISPAHNYNIWNPKT